MVSGDALIDAIEEQGLGLGAEAALGRLVPDSQGDQAQAHASHGGL
jgi:hypothetical protein